jgi:hypothetical protein
LAVHTAVALWAVAGLVELARPSWPWPAVGNPDLPAGVLVVHWLLMLGTGSVFLVGYARGWRTTPAAMATCYAALATMCAVETFGYLTNDSRFVDMGLEYVTYAVLLGLLYRAPVRDLFRTATARSVHWPGDEPPGAGRLVRERWSPTSDI